VDVPTLEGQARLTVPPGTQDDSVFRLKGSGLPRLDARGKGDEYIRVRIKVPKKLTSEQKQLLKKFSELEGSKKSFLDKLKGS